MMLGIMIYWDIIFGLNPAVMNDKSLVTKDTSQTMASACQIVALCSSQHVNHSTICFRWEPDPLKGANRGYVWALMCFLDCPEEHLTVYKLPLRHSDWGFKELSGN